MYLAGRTCCLYITWIIYWKQLCRYWDEYLSITWQWLLPGYLALRPVLLGLIWKYFFRMSFGCQSLFQTGLMPTFTLCSMTVYGRFKHFHMSTSISTIRVLVISRVQWTPRSMQTVLYFVVIRYGLSGKIIWLRLCRWWNPIKYTWINHTIWKTMHNNIYNNISTTEQRTINQFSYIIL